jgi:hypothetical protein
MCRRLKSLLTSRLDVGDWRCIIAVKTSRQRIQHLYHQLALAHLRQRSRASLIFLRIQLIHHQGQHHGVRLHLHLHHAISFPHPFPQVSASVPHRHVSFHFPINTSAAFPRPVRHLHSVMEFMRIKSGVRHLHRPRSSVGFHFCRRILYPCLFAKFWHDFCFARVLINDE